MVQNNNNKNDTSNHGTSSTNISCQNLFHCVFVLSRTEIVLIRTSCSSLPMKSHCHKISATNNQKAITTMMTISAQPFSTTVILQLVVLAVHLTVCTALSRSVSLQMSSSQGRVALVTGASRTFLQNNNNNNNIKRFFFVHFLILKVPKFLPSLFLFQLLSLLSFFHFL